MSYSVLRFMEVIMDRLRAMELFLSVSRTESFTETARVFGLSATSVSRAISDLEDVLKARLLIRSTRQVALTEAGLEYARSVEGILWSIKEVETSVSAITAAPQGHLRVHSRMMFGLGVLTPLIAEFRRLYPDISVELLMGEKKVDLRREKVDIDFRIAPPAEAGLKRRMLFVSERHLVASPEYLRKAPALTAPWQLAEHATLAYALPGGGFVWRFRREDDGVDDIAITPRHISNSGMALLELARMGEGIALLDDYTVTADVARGALVRLLPECRVSNTTFEEGMYATIIDSPVVPAKIRVFLDFVAGRVSGSERRFSVFRREQLEAAE